MGGIQGVGHKLSRVAGPLDDVNLFALQFSHYAVHTAAALSDAGTDGINHHVSAVDCDLGTASGFAGNILDRYDAACDFRHFHFEQALDQVRVDPADVNLGSVSRILARLVHFKDINLDVVSVVQFFAGDHFILFQHAFGTAQVDIRGLGFNPLNNTGQDFTFFFDIFVIDLSAFSFTDMLDDYLLGRLGSHAQEAVGCNVHLGNVPHLIGGIDLLRFFQADLVGGILNLLILQDQLPGIYGDTAVLAVYSNVQVVRSSFRLRQVLPVCGLQGLLNGLEKCLLRDFLFSGQHFDCVYDFGFHVSCPFSRLRVVLIIAGKIDVLDTFHVHHRFDQRSRLPRHQHPAFTCVDHDVSFFKTSQDTGKYLCPVYRLEDFNLDLTTEIPFKIPVFFQRPVNARRGYFHEVVIHAVSGCPDGFVEYLAVIQAYALFLVDVKPQILSCRLFIHADINELVAHLLCNGTSLRFQAGKRFRLRCHLSVSHPFRAMKKSGKQALHQPALTVSGNTSPYRSPKAFRLFPFLTLNPSFKALRRF